MGTRYIVDETGERVSVVIDVADYERMIEAQSKVVEAARVLQEAVRMMAGSGSRGTGYAGYRRALSRVIRIEATEVIRTHEADTEKLERGEGDLSS
jgi:hypothetical protein